MTYFSRDVKTQREKYKREIAEKRKEAEAAVSSPLHVLVNPVEMLT